MKSFNVGGVEVGPDQPIFVIGEVGINHNGSIEKAKELIDVAVDAGCSAVKFQKRDLSEIYTDDVLNNLKNYEQGFQYLIPILKDYEFSNEQLIEIKNYCESKGIIFICTPFDPISADFLESLNVPAYKTSSADLTNFYLFEKLVEFNKPMFISTGMSSYEEIDKTVEFLEKHNANFVLLHCVSSYPVNYDDANMLRIKELEQRYGKLIGYSGHDDGITLPIVAASLGAVVVEKHITLDRDLRGPDHKFSLLPNELKEMNEELVKAKKSILSSKSYLLQGEMLNKLVFRKSIVARENIKEGETITSEKLAAKSPGTGLSVQHYFDLIGTKAKRNFTKEELFTDKDLISNSNEQLSTRVNWANQGYVVRYHDFESVLDFNTDSLEFHFTYKDTLLEIPHAKFKKYSEKLKDKTLRIHCNEYIGEELFDINNENLNRRLKAQKMLQKVIDITSEISVYFKNEKPLIVFNNGAMSRHDEPNTLKIPKEDFYKHFKDLDLKNTGLIAQNMPPFPWYFGGQWRGHYFLEAEELIDFCKVTGESICLDTSHAQMTCNYLNISFNEYVEKLKPYVKHIHISDAKGVEGEGTPMGEGDIDWNEFFEIYKDYKGTWIPEIWQGHVNNHQGAKEALTYINNILNPRKS